MMSDALYRDALKKGQKEKRRCISEGIYPYLPSLDDLLTKEQQATGTRIGIRPIPFDFIVGTKTAGRANTFARNFMPLMDEDTEFAEKWRSLCNFHIEEGICDAIKVYEYMNRYYVEEGNKRVCLLKLFDAIDIQAEVIRIYPEKTDQKNVIVYYELLDFYNYSKVNYVEFSNPGDYQLLQKYVGKEPDGKWSDDDRIRFKSAHYYFKKAFKELNGEQMKISVGDALLIFLKIYGYEDLCEKNSDEIKTSLGKIWEEIRLLDEEDTIDLKTMPESAKKRILFQRMPWESSPKIRKVAFIYDKNPNTSGWVYGHELGRMHLERAFEGTINTTAYEDAMEKTPQLVIEQAIADGNKILFTTSAKFLPACIAAAVEHPEVKIFNCSLNKAHRYIYTYYARMYEVKFIIGAIAGAMTQNGKVGYLCDYPIYGQIAGINAFAIGVQMVNPNATVYLDWSCLGGSDNALKRLKQNDIHIISSQDMAKAEENGRTDFGLFEIVDDRRINLAMPIWHWGVYYEKLIQGILKNIVQQEYEASRKALNYYWGMSAGVVELLCSNHLPDSVKKMVDILEKAICNGMSEPFQGVFYTQDGQRIEGKDKKLSLSEIINMDWLLNNIQGSIPSYEDLNGEGKETVDCAGTPDTKIEW